MNRDQVENALATRVEILRAEGESWWPGVKIAPIAYRRVLSFSRRNQSKNPTTEEQIIDLRKGLQAHFEPGVSFTHESDWNSLAAELLQVFQGFDEDKSDI